MAQARTRIMNQLQALNEGLRGKKRLWRERGRQQLESSQRNAAPRLTFRQLTVVSDVSRFAEGAPILNGDDEIVSEQRIHGCEIPSLINVKHGACGATGRKS
jgi:hypothetical protein